MGLFDTEIDAHNAWKECKLESLEKLREQIDSIDPRIYSSILSRVETMYGYIPLTPKTKAKSALKRVVSHLIDGDFDTLKL